MDGTANVLLNARSYEEMADVYGMSARRRTFLYELMQPEFQRTFASMTGNTAFFETSKAGLDELLATLPEGLDDILELDAAFLRALLKRSEIFGVLGQAQPNRLAHKVRHGTVRGCRLEPQRAMHLRRQVDGCSLRGGAHDPAG